MTSLSKILAVPFLILLAFIAYELFYIEDSTNSVWLIPAVVGLAVIFVFHNQIDLWWMSKKQPDPDIRVVQLLDQKIIPYRKLDVDRKRKLSRELNVFVHGCEFIPMGLKNIPEDLKFMCSLFAFFLGKNKSRIWLKNYNRFALYKHPFLSPDYPDTIHTCEHHKEDGIFIFSLEQLIPAIDDPEKYYNIALHEFARAYLSTVQPEIKEDQFSAIWDKLDSLGICSKTAIEKIIGLEQESPLPVLLSYYILFPDIIASHFGQYSEFLRSHTDNIAR